MASLEGYIVFNAEMFLRTGLRVGGGGDRTEIGGIENPIIKNPVTGEPYIPGSSIKGKLRSIMEWEFGKVGEDGKPCDCADVNCPVCRVFGVGGYKVNLELGPTRLIVRDALMTEATHKQYMDIVKETGLPPIEKKFENTINRRRGSAQLPRIMERIPAGMSMDFEIAYRVFNMNNDAEKDMMMYMEFLKVVKFLESDTLGGSGSRGYGRVEIRGAKVTFNFRDRTKFAQPIGAIEQAVRELFPARVAAAA